MDQICMYLPIKPISYNQSHVVVGNVLRSSTLKKKFQREASKLITPFSKDLKKFATSHMGRPVQMKIRYIFWVPRADLIAKSTSGISKTSLDVDNAMKCINDVVFKRMEKFNPDINDAYVTYMGLEKRPSPKEQYGITIHLSSQLLKIGA